LHSLFYASRLSVPAPPCSSCLVSSSSSVPFSYSFSCSHSFFSYLPISFPVLICWYCLYISFLVHSTFFSIAPFFFNYIAIILFNAE
jgi:hypothetical protein